jgi:hypothetical protein
MAEVSDIALAPIGAVQRTRVGREATEPMRTDIRLLGTILGDTVHEQNGDEVFDLVERARAESFRVRSSQIDRAEMSRMFDGVNIHLAIGRSAISPSWPTSPKTAAAFMSTLANRPQESSLSSIYAKRGLAEPHSTTGLNPSPGIQMCDGACHLTFDREFVNRPSAETCPSAARRTASRNTQPHSPTMVGGLDKRVSDTFIEERFDQSTPTTEPCERRSIFRPAPRPHYLIRYLVPSREMRGRAGAVRLGWGKVATVLRI